MRKLKLAHYILTGCEGCSSSLIDLLVNYPDILEHFEIVSSRIIGYTGIVEADIALVEGSIITQHDLERAREIRENSRIVIAYGSCSYILFINSLKRLVNDMDLKHVYKNIIPAEPHIEPKSLTRAIKVDYFIPGCPPDPKETYKILTSILLGKRIRYPDKPVCYECRQKNIPCLLKEGKLCLGPITMGGCGAKCPLYSSPCWGCRGPATEADTCIFEKAIKEFKIDPMLLYKKLQMLFGDLRD